MAVTYDRVEPRLKVRIYDPAQGDPVVIDRGFRWYDPLLLTGHAGSFNVTSNGTAKLELLPEIGLVCRPFLALKDTRLAHYTTSGGSWEERRPATGSPRVYRLVQYDTTAGIQYSATSAFSLPKNPHIALSFILPDSPSDWDSTTYPQYVRCELGGGAWAVQITKSDAYLLRKVDGSYQAVAQFDFPALSSDVDEKLLFVRCLRGKLGVSSDFGKTYTWFGFADGTAAEIPAGRVTWRGQGGMVVVGLHQLQYVTGVYTSPTRDMLDTHSGSATFTDRSTVPTGTSLAYTAFTSGQEIYYTAQLTPHSSGSLPFACYSTPEVYAVQVQFPVVRSNELNTSTLPFDGDALSADITKPLELDQTSATIEIRLDATEQFSGPARWRKVELEGGFEDSAGAEYWWPLFTGYLRDPDVSQQEHNKQTLILQVDGATVRAKRGVWDDFTVPLGGQTVNQALDAVLDAMGLEASDRNWHVKGDLVTLPPGSPENPFLWPQAGESYWDTLRNICDFAGLEIFTTDLGVWETLPKGYFDPFVSHVLQAEATGPLELGVQRIAFHCDASQSATAVLVRGQDEWGNAIWAWGVDSQAEGNPFSGRFCPWRELHYEAIPGTTTPGMLASVVQARFAELVPLKFETDVTTLLNLDVLRRQVVRITGTTVGIADWDQFLVLTVRHHLEPRIGLCKTTLGGRRLN